MIILVASDIHGRLEAVKQLESNILRFTPDKIFLLGDYLYNGPRNGVPEDYDPMKVCEILNKYSSIIEGVRGNCDANIDLDLLSFDITPKKVIEVLNKRFVLFHGDNDPRNLVDLQSGDILVSGHTHLLNTSNCGQYVCLNPGSIGFPKGGNPASFALISEDKIEIRKLEDGEVIQSLCL